MNKTGLLVIFFVSAFINAFTQNLNKDNTITHADTLRGTILPERAWWNVLHYDIQLEPDYNTKTIRGINSISFAYKKRNNLPMQIDLQHPLIIDSIKLATNKLSYKKIDSNVYYVQFKNEALHPDSGMDKIAIYYHGTPVEATMPPWDGGVIWARDSLNRPWISITCETLGASSWLPCKDHLSDEPDSGVSFAITVPDTLTAVANGRLFSIINPSNGKSIYTWQVKNPINNYNIIPYIGKYVHFNDTLHGEKGVLNLNYWVLDYNLTRAKKQFKQADTTLRCFEYWFSPYPFYEDGYKLVEAPHLGMEHQSAIAYGNKFKNGYAGTDLSHTGLGLTWDFIIVHETAHEWFGNNITSKDVADLWIHESFANYSETLYTEWLHNKQAGNEYNFGIRKNIQNKTPVTGAYDINSKGSIDMYYKGGNLVHIIRNLINDDITFRNLLRGLNTTFYHQTVSAAQIEKYIIQFTGLNLEKTFDQYLRHTTIPALEYYYSSNGKKLFYRWQNAIPGFNMPLVIKDSSGNILSISPEAAWKKIKKHSAFNPQWIERNYYITISEVSSKK